MNGTDAPPVEQAPPPEQPPPEEQKPDEPALGDDLQALAKKLFFVAEGAGEPVITRHGNTVMLTYPDDSLVRATLESRPGRHLALGPKGATGEETRERNKAFEASKKLEEDRKAAAQAAGTPKEGQQAA